MLFHINIVLELGGHVAVNLSQNLLSALAHIQRTNLISDSQNSSGSNGQFIHTDGQEGLGHFQICAQLAADADPNAVLMCVLHDHLQQTDHGQVVGIVEAAQIVVLTVASQGVLGQVVGAAGEEVNFLSQSVGNDSCCGSFDHDTDLNMVGVRNTLSIQFLLDGLDQFLGLADFPDAGDHGEHDAQLAVSRSAVQRSQLGTEECGTAQADTQCAYP